GLRPFLIADPQTAGFAPGDPSIRSEFFRQVGDGGAPWGIADHYVGASLSESLAHRCVGHVVLDAERSLRQEDVQVSARILASSGPIRQIGQLLVMLNVGWF